MTAPASSSDPESEQKQQPALPQDADPPPVDPLGMTSKCEARILGALKNTEVAGSVVSTHDELCAELEKSWGKNYRDGINNRLKLRKSLYNLHGAGLIDIAGDFICEKDEAFTVYMTDAGAAFLSKLEVKAPNLLQKSRSPNLMVASEVN
jgi:hypothetical protein